MAEEIEKLTAAITNLGLAVQDLTQRVKEGQGYSKGEVEVLTTLARQLGELLEKNQIFQGTLQLQKENEMLNLLGQKLGSALHLDEVLSLIIESLKEVVPYDAVGIYLVDPQGGRIVAETLRGYDLEMEEKCRVKVGEGVMGWVVKTAQGAIVPDVSRDPRYVNARPQTRSEMAYPLKSDGRVIGCFNLESDRLDAYTPEHLKLLEVFANHTVVAIERAQLHQELVKKRRLEDELLIARRIQKSFLPRENPSFGSLDICGLNIPSEEVGGDYYDFITLTDTDLGVAIGDVAGKGIAGALIMASFQASLRSESHNNFAIRTILKKVNHFLFETTSSERFVTAFYGVIDCKQMVLTYANAGHDPPLLFRSTGETLYLEKGGSMLGAFDGAEFKEERVGLKPGDVLILYTDGATEARDKKGEEFGVRRLEEAVREHRDLEARKLVDSLYRAIAGFTDISTQEDDITLVAIKVAEENETLLIESRPEEVEKADELAEQVARKMGFFQDEVDNLAIAVTEVVNNAIIHGNKLDPGKHVCIRFIHKGDRLEVRVKDEGEGFDPSKLADPTRPENLMKKEGRGIFVIRHLVDDVSFKRMQDGMEVILVKYHRKDNY